MFPVAVKKRKYANVDPSQHRMDRFLSFNTLAQAKDDPMEIDIPSTAHKSISKDTVLGTVRQQSLTPRIVITNPKRKAFPSWFFFFQKTNCLIFIFSSHSRKATGNTR